MNSRTRILASLVLAALLVSWGWLFGLNARDAFAQPEWVGTSVTTQPYQLHVSENGARAWLLDSRSGEVWSIFLSHSKVEDIKLLYLQREQPSGEGPIDRR